MIITSSSYDREEKDGWSPYAELKRLSSWPPSLPVFHECWKELPGTTGRLWGLRLSHGSLERVAWLCSFTTTAAQQPQDSHRTPCAAAAALEPDRVILECARSVSASWVSWHVSLVFTRDATKRGYSSFTKHWNLDSTKWNFLEQAGGTAVVSGFSACWTLKGCSEHSRMSASQRTERSQNPCCNGKS